MAVEVPPVEVASAVVAEVASAVVAVAASEVAVVVASEVTVEAVEASEVAVEVTVEVAVDSEEEAVEPLIPTRLPTPVELLLSKERNFHSEQCLYNYKFYVLELLPRVEGIAVSF